MGKSYFSLVSALFVFAVLWTPALSEDKCTLGCKGTATTPDFLTGHKYNYGVEGTVSIFLTGADKQETNVKLIGEVSVTSLGNCVNVLRVTNLVFSGPDGKKYQKPTGIDKPVRFTLQDGQIGTDICTEEGDTRRSLNIKRAIISLLQSGQKSGNEVDIFGICPTETSSSQEGGAVLLHRFRDLSRCAHREHGKSVYSSAVYNPTAEIKNTQVLQSILNIESKINNGVPEKISALEEHLYKPFSVGENGARSRVITKMNLISKAAGTDTGNFKEARSIIFENPHGVTMEQSNYNTALQALKETAKSVAHEASTKSAGNFAHLIRIFRTSKKDDLNKIFNAVKGNELERRVYLDALLRSGTGYSIETSLQLMKTSDLSPLEKKLVLLSLGNAMHVNEDALKAAAAYIDLDNVPKEAFVGIGALAGAYCRSHNCHETKSPGIVALSQKLGAKLNCKAKGKDHEDFAVSILRGIRSIRHLEDSLIEKLVHCATDNGVKNRVKVAALEAFHADPCASKIKKAGLDIMKNRQLDSELRIKAYMAVIACPCGKSANEIKTLLDSEPVHQVGHFITSSLRHIRASTNPDKQLARQHYGLITTPRKFNVDDRKYSFYRELSYDVGALGIGGTYENTVIYSQDSFLPRSASFNLTAEVFGHNVNVFEIGGRQGNLDRVAEHFLGPKSFLRTQDPQALYDDLLKRFEETEKKVEGKIRGRRSVKTDVDNFDKHIKDESVPFDNQLDMDIYIKLLGTDAIFLSLGDEKGFDFNKVLDELLHFVETGVSSAKKFQQELRAHMLFLDAELAYATSTGLPLKLNLIGAATGRFEVSTNVDIRQILRDQRNAKIDFKLVPSTDIELAGHFFVDADVVATGLKVVTNLHSSTGGHVIAKVLENGQGFDLQLGLPIEKQEIITASNDLIYFTTEKGQQEKAVVIKTDMDRKEYSGCFDQLSGMLGLTLCGEVSVPFSVSGPDAQASVQKFLARYPLTGSSVVKLHLEKNDLKGYHVKGVFKLDQEAKKSFEMLFEAEGSKNRRTAIAGEYIMNAEEKSVMLSLESPIKTVYGKAALLTKPHDYAVMVKAKMDDQEYFAKAGFNVQGNDNRRVFKPDFQYEMPGGQGKKSLKVDGQVVQEKVGKGTKYTLEGIKVDLPNNEVVDLNGNVNIQETGFETEVQLKKAEHNAQLKASVNKNDVKVEFLNTLNPFVNFRLNAHSDFQQDNIRNDIELFYNGDLKSQQNRVTFNQLLKYNRKTENFGLITKNKFVIHALPFKAEVNAEVDPKKFDVEVEGQYVEQNAKFEIEARKQIKKPGDYSVKVEGALNKDGFEALAKRDIINPDKSNFENYINIKNIGKYELSGVVLHKMKTNDVHVGAVGHFKFTGNGKTEDIKFDFGAVENPNLYSSHAKISRGKPELLDFLLKVNRGASGSAQLKLILKETIAVNGQFKTQEGEKGNGMIIIDFKKAQRKIKGDIKFSGKKPNYNTELELFLNFEKDNADKLHIASTNKYDEHVLDSKNKFEYAGKKFEVNVNRNGELELTKGKFTGGLEVVLPTERCLNLKVHREMDLKGDVSNGHAEVTLSDAPKRGAAGSTITYKGKIINTDFEHQKVDYEGQFLLKLKDGKNLDNSFVFKQQPDGKNFKIDFKNEVKGNLIPAPASIQGSMQYSDPEVIDGFAKVHLKGNYGQDYSFDIASNAEANIIEKGDKKYKEDNTITVRLPYEGAHDIKVVYNVFYLLPENRESSEYNFLNSFQLNADTYKLEGAGKFAQNNGFSKFKVLVPHVDPFSLDTSYKAQLEGEKKSGSVDIKTTYGKGKTANIVIDASAQPQERSLVVKATAPEAEKLKKLVFNIVTKNPSPDTVSSFVTIEADSRVYKGESLIVYSKSQPLIDIKFTCPNNPPSRFYLKGNSLSSTQGKVDLKIENIKDLSLEASSEANIQKDDITVVLTGDSEKLGMKKYKFEISSKDAGAGKRLELTAVNNGKNLLSGGTSFISKQEGPKTIIEGSGSVKVGEEQKSATFKYIRTLLTEGSEQGVERFMNVAIGDRSYVAESRVTNLEYKTSYVYCEEKKQCAHAELHSKINMQKPGSIQHSVNAGLDLRKLGFAPEFGLQYNSEVSDKKLPQYTLDVHMNKEDKKFHIHAYSLLEHGKFPTGITISYPKRVIALESELVYPTKGQPFPIKASAIFSLDKNNPAKTASARMMIDVTGADKTHAAVAEFGFNHPKVGKESTVKFTGKLQVPTQNNVKFESSAVVSVPTLGADREAKFLFEANPSTLKVYIDSPITKIIDLEGSATVKDNLQKADLKFSLLQGKPVTVSAIAKDFQYFEFTTGYSEDSNRKLTIIGHIEPEKRVDISADIVLPNEKKNIVHGALFVQDYLVKSDYGLSQENFKYFTSALTNDMENLKKRIEQIGEKASNDFTATLKKIEPKYKELEAAYREELQQLASELSNDVILKDISKAFNDILRLVVTVVESVIETTRPVIERMQKICADNCKKIQEMYEQKIQPQLKQLYENIGKILHEYTDGLIDLVAHYAAIIADFFEKHKAELQELTNTFTEIYRDLVHIITDRLKEFREAAAQMFAQVTAQIKDMPIVVAIQEKIKEFIVPEQFLNLLSEAHNAIRSILPTEQSKALSDAVVTYVQKKLRQEKVDDAAELRVIADKFAAALTSIVQYVKYQLNQFSVPGINSDFMNFSNLPFLATSGQWANSVGSIPAFSILNQLSNGDFPDPIKVLQGYRPRSINPLDEVPAKLRAIIVNGQHIFTFDGRHMTFPGTCRYVLAHDYVDRNFTLIMNMANGVAKSILLEDKTGNTVEYKDNGQVALNGAAHGFPVHEKDLFAFRGAAGEIGVGTTYGLLTFCTPKLEVCYVEVNGFYLGKLRGLLGDGNNEPYDDFRLPNGKVVESEAEFGNAYRLSGSCPQVKTPEHSAHQHHAALPAACETVFGSTSPLRLLSLFLDVLPFRQACIHAVSPITDPKAALAQACDLAKGYTALAVTGALPAVVPPECMRCTDAGDEKKIGEMYEFTLPATQADIIIAVETTKVTEKTYKELVVPVVGQIIDGLKAKKIDDVKVFLVGITSSMPWPIMYDTDNKLKNAKVEFKDESRYQHTKTVDFHVPSLTRAAADLAKFADDLRVTLGATNVLAGYHAIMDLPLRPRAVKHGIGVSGETCKNQLFLLEAFRALKSQIIFDNIAYSSSFVTVTPITINGNADEGKNVVGFGDDSVIMLGDKKRGKDTEALRETLGVERDACINFAEDTKGMLFSSKNFHEMNPGQQKQFIHAMSGSAIERMTRHSLVQRCTCTYVNPFYARSICVNVAKKEASRRRK